MTNKEAVDVLRACADLFEGDEALEIKDAIAALQRPEPTGDLVSLEAVLDVLEKEVQHWCNCRMNGYCSVCQIWFSFKRAARALPRALSVAAVGARLMAAGIRLDICAYHWDDGDDMENHQHAGCVCNPKHGPPLPEAIAALLEEVENVVAKKFDRD